MDSLYNLQEACQKLGISKQTLKSIIKRNEISYTTVGKRKKFTDEQISQYLKNNTK